MIWTAVVLLVLDNFPAIQAATLIASLGSGEIANRLKSTRLRSIFGEQLFFSNGDPLPATIKFKRMEGRLFAQSQAARF